MATITCPACRASSEAPAEFIGRSVRCRGCRTEFKADLAPTVDMPARLPGPVHADGLPSRMGPAAPPAPSPMKPCPFCAEMIQAAAVKCKHCSEFLDPALRAAVVAPQTAPAFRRYDEPIERPRRAEASVQVVQQVAVVQRPEPYHVPHLLHLLLCLITAGLWLPIWILHTLLNDRR